jgi:cycloeucalenol cycloisomerase
MATVCVVPPVLFPGRADRHRRWQERFVVKANVWNAVFGFVGNYLWTHYFYELLGAEYTFPNWRFNDVPVSCYLATQPYFCFYHTFTTLVLRYGDQRRHWTKRWQAIMVLLLAYGTAVAETLTIAAFPHYRFKDWYRMMTVGSAFYGLYFVVSFPLYYRIDEEDVMKRARWTLGEVVLDALAAAMLVTLLLDAWRLVIGGIGEGLWAPANPWMGHVSVAGSQ